MPAKSQEVENTSQTRSDAAVGTDASELGEGNSSPTSVSKDLKYEDEIRASFDSQQCYKT